MRVAAGAATSGRRRDPARASPSGRGSNPRLIARALTTASLVNLTSTSAPVVPNAGRAKLFLVNAALDAESNLLRVPQIVHVADCSAFTTGPRTEEKRCAIAHGFDSADYTDESEIAWIAVEIDAKLEAL